MIDLSHIPTERLHEIDYVAIPGFYQPSPWGIECHRLRKMGIDEALVAGSAGTGKALDPSTPIPTPGGFVEIGKLIKGDKVFDEKGSVCSVVGVRKWRSRPCYKITFDDGTVIVADEQHEWLTIGYAARRSESNAKKRDGRRTGLNDQRHKAKKPSVVTTLEISRTLRYKGRINHAVRCAEPIDPDSFDIQIPPYFLGIWLGDGTSTGGGITTADKWIADYIRSVGFKVSENKAKYHHHVSGILPLLRHYNLIKNKHIPPQYLWADVGVRFALLQGLMDTDGSVDARGMCEITLCNKRLASDTLILARSLGLKATIHESDAKLNGRVVGRRWRITFSPRGMQVCRMPRKARRIKRPVNRTTRWRYIMSVEPVEPRDTVCIQVDSPSHLFLASEAFIPTHNSVWGLNDAVPIIVVANELCRRGEIQWGELVDDQCLHLRRLTGGLETSIRRAHPLFKALDENVRYREKDHTFMFSSGLRFVFGHCKDPRDWEQYYTASFVHIFFDEVIQFTKEQYEQISSRKRATNPVLRKMVSVRSASNPGPGWVRDLFVKPNPTGRKVLRRTLDDGSSATRIFVPATIDDNPDKAFVEQYKRNLMSREEHIKRALLYGDWWVTADSFFADHWRPDLHVIPPFRIPGDWPRFRALDWGYKTYGCVLWFAMDPDGNLICEREYTFRMKDGREVAMAIRKIEEGMGLWNGRKSKITGPADTSLWGETSSADSHAEQMARHGVIWMKADKRSRRMNAERVLSRLDSHMGGTQRPGLVFFAGMTEKCCETLPGLPADPEALDEDKRNAPKKCDDDHWYDALSYMCAYRAPRMDAFMDRMDKRKKKFMDDDDEPKRRSRKSWGRGGYGANY